MALGRRKTSKTEPRPFVLAETIPPGLQIAGAFSWRILTVVGVAAVFIFLVMQLRYIVIPLMIAILLAALLVPFVQWLVRHNWPKWLAVTIAELGTIGIVTGLVYLVVLQVVRGLGDLQDRSLQAFEDFKTFLLESPLALTETQINDYVANLFAELQQNSEFLISGALSVGTGAGHFLAGLLLVLFATLFILIDGDGIWAWTVRLFPRRARRAVNGAGRSGWLTLTTFVKVQIFVAAVDAVGIGLGAWILGLFYGGFPLIIPIAVAVFLGSFIPIVGALVTGALAVFIALLYLGPIPALIMLGIVLLVQQVEGHVLQPLVMGTAVKVHPLAVVFAVAAGSAIAGIPGALFAVPIIATLNVMVKYVASGAWRESARPLTQNELSNV